ncbi:hypothetical protein Tco_1081955 [Tanacetum coccineum]|uniref:Uncharacterized protein n=1 Tax=Tanacetum coccineum TaxID=301880 RepID=A0ABQ5HZE1_9ASTR
MRRVGASNPVIDKFKRRLTEWKAKTSIHGVSGGLGDVRGVERVVKGGGVWREIIRIGEELEGLGIDFTSSLEGVVGNGREVGFWIDRWVGRERLCDRFSRLYHLDSRKEGRVADKGKWVNGEWQWEREWVRELRGRACRDFNDLTNLLQNVVIDMDCRDRWKWTLQENGVFTVKELSRMVEEKTLRIESGCQETIWNKLVPKKVICLCERALKR